MKLFIDTATEVLHVALYDEKLIEAHNHIGKNDHSKTLMVEIEEILLRNNVTVKDLTEIIVGEGPGSYTGVRIGVVVAKTLANFLNIPLYSVSSLELMASDKTGVVPVVIDARRGNYFCAVYNRDNHFECLVEPKMRKIEEFEALCNKDDIVTTEGITINPLILNKKLIEDIHVFSPNYLREWGE